MPTSLQLARIEWQRRSIVWSNDASQAGLSGAADPGGHRLARSQAPFLLCFTDSDLLVCPTVLTIISQVNQRQLAVYSYGTYLRP